MKDSINPRIIDRAHGFIRLAGRSDNSVREIDAKIMLLAFACELCLKGLGANSGHDLIELYGHLGIQRKKSLSDLYSRETGNADLESDLAAVRTLFVDIRYYHESTGIAVGVSSLQKMAEFLLHAGILAVEDRSDRTFISQGC